MMSIDAISSDDTDVGEDPDEELRAMLQNAPLAKRESRTKPSSLQTRRPPMLLSGDLPSRNGQPISADSATLQQEKRPDAMEASVPQPANSSITSTKSRRNLRRNVSTPARTDGTVPLTLRPHSSPGHSKTMATSSIYRGVSWHGPSKQWRATIFANQKPRHLAYYVDEVEAARAYDLAAVQLRTAAGAGRFLNFPDDLEIYEAKINSGEQLLHLDALGQPTAKSNSKASRNKSPTSPAAKVPAKGAAGNERPSNNSTHRSRAPQQPRRTSADTIMQDASATNFGEPYRKWPALPLSDSTLRPRQTSPSDASMGAGFWSQPLQSSHAEHASMHSPTPRPHSDNLVSARFSAQMDDEMLYESDWHDDSHAAVSKAIMMMHNEHALLHPPHRVHHALMRSPAVSSQTQGFDTMMYSVPQSRLNSMSGTWDTRNVLSAHSFADHGMNRPNSNELRMSCLDESLAQLQELIGSDHSEDMM